MKNIDEVQRVAHLLGGAQVLRRRLATPLDAHELLLDGLPVQALSHLLESLGEIRLAASVEKAVGMSLRTFQRRKDAPEKRLSLEHSKSPSTRVFGRWIRSAMS